MSEGWTHSQSYVRLETNGTEERLRADYALNNLESTRKQILLRRALSILAIEEKRLYSLTDSEAIAELDALKAKQDSMRVEISSTS